MKNNQSKDKLFIVKKYIYAKNAAEALRKERQYRPDDVWVDEEWRKEHKTQLSSAIGFDSVPDYVD